MNTVFTCYSSLVSRSLSFLNKNYRSALGLLALFALLQIILSLFHGELNFLHDRSFMVIASSMALVILMAWLSFVLFRNSESALAEYGRSFNVQALVQATLLAQGLLMLTRLVLTPHNAVDLYALRFYLGMTLGVFVMPIALGIPLLFTRPKTARDLEDRRRVIRSFFLLDYFFSGTPGEFSKKLKYASVLLYGLFLALLIFCFATHSKKSTTSGRLLHIQLQTMHFNRGRNLMRYVLQVDTGSSVREIAIMPADMQRFHPHVGDTVTIRHHFFQYNLEMLNEIADIRH